MPSGLTIGATEFARRFARIKEDVREHGVVRVESHGRVVGGFLSPKELATYERLKRQEREVLRAGELPDDLLADLKDALDRYDG